MLVVVRIVIFCFYRELELYASMKIQVQVWLHEILRHCCKFLLSPSYPRPFTGTVATRQSPYKFTEHSSELSAFDLIDLFHLTLLYIPFIFTMSSSLLPLELRLRTLEAQLFGVPSSLLSDPDSPSSTSPSALSTPPVTRRILNVAQGLHQLGESSDGVKRLLEGCTCLSFDTMFLGNGDF